MYWCKLFFCIRSLVFLEVAVHSLRCLRSRIAICRQYDNSQHTGGGYQGTKNRQSHKQRKDHLTSNWLDAHSPAGGTFLGVGCGEFAPGSSHANLIKERSGDTTYDCTTGGQNLQVSSHSYYAVFVRMSGEARVRMLDLPGPGNYNSGGVVIDGSTNTAESWVDCKAQCFETDGCETVHFCEPSSTRSFECWGSAAFSKSPKSSFCGGPTRSAKKYSGE